MGPIRHHLKWLRAEAILELRPTPQLQARISELLEKTSGYDNFILSSGCDVPPHSPIDNIKAFYQALAEYNEKD